MQHMKKSTFLFALVLLVLFNCHESKDTIQENQIAPLNRNVGKKISMEEAQRWINRFKEKGSSSRNQSEPNVTYDRLSLILNPIDEKIGVSFHRAIDEAGSYHILLVPLKEGTTLWDQEYVLDANGNTLINTEIGRGWANRYRSENPNGVWSHFFGTHVVDQEFSNIVLADATNDQGMPQLLLFMWRNPDSGGGRSNAETPDVYDASAPCPPTCSGSEL
jgi:hypothetical protein